MEKLTSDTRLKAEQTYHLAYAVQELGRALGERYTLSAINHAEQAIRNISEFIGDVAPTPELTEVEGEVARNLHTYMRKYMDGPLSCILYRLISDSKGLAIWYAFVKGLVQSNGNYQKAMVSVDEMSQEHGDTDSLLMESSLRLWEDFKSDKVWDNVKFTPTN